MRPDENKDKCNLQQQMIPGKFEDANIEEKIKRLHLVLSEIRRSLHWMHQGQGRLNTKIRALENHQHSEKGDCMIRIEDSNKDSLGYGEASNSIDLLA